LIKEIDDFNTARINKKMHKCNDQCNHRDTVIFDIHVKNQFQDGGNGEC
jgi:hypothetical protein